ncbi:MAG: OmpA family protein [Treponema sp.]|jgi:outer membrane protein OmpA-like peptidoglycan-associated protein|nr:OmpA family protein [Treponema sp.]
MNRTGIFRNPLKRIIVPLVLGALVNGLYAETVFSDGDYWSLDAGFGMTDILVKGLSYQLIVDPRICFSPALMLGSKMAANYSTDEILTFEGQLYLRWNFLRLGPPERTANIFLQSGVGMLAAYRGNDTPFSDLTKNRGSMMVDAAAGVTIPLGSRWHIEPSVRGGYPHIMGASITVGCKSPLPYKSRNKNRSSDEILKNIKIASIEYVMFGPDTGKYNADIDRNTREMNEQVLDVVAKALKENPEYRIRIEGHANPVTNDPSEAKRLMNISQTRANAIAGQLRARGVCENQMITIAFGGTRPFTSAYDNRDKNRRVELIVILVNAD